MKSAHFLLILLTTCSLTAGLLSFKIQHGTGYRYLYCTAAYGERGHVQIYPTIAPPTVAFCTTVFNDSCFKATTVNFKFY